MALNHATATVTTTATPIVTLPRNSQTVEVYFQNLDATNDIFLGDKTVSTSGARAGLKIVKNSAITAIKFDGGDQIYAISNGGTPLLTMLWTKN